MRLLRSLVLALLLFARDQAPLLVVAHAEATGQIGTSEQWGYFADHEVASGQKRRYPSIDEALLFASGAEVVHNFYPGDEALDIALGPRRALFFFDPTLDWYTGDTAAIIANLQRYEHRAVILISEPNNSTFTTQYATPQVTAKRLVDYFDFITPLCPTCPIYGPTLAQAGVVGIDDPFWYEERTLQELQKLGRQDVIKRLGISANFYQRGAAPFLWAWNIAAGLQRLKAISLAYGGRNEAVVPEIGAPFGTVDQQPVMAQALTAIMPTLREEAAASYYFTAAWAEEKWRGFNGKGNVFEADGKTLTAVGHALGLSGCLSQKDMAARWPAASVAAIMAAEKCR